MDLSGIHNVGEFYSHHYLESALEGDLKDILRAWSEAEKEGQSKHPARQLGALADRYFQERSQARLEQDRRERWLRTHNFHCELLKALSYPSQPCLVPLEVGCLPVMLAQQKDGHPYLWVVEAPFPLEDDDDAFDESPEGCPYGEGGLSTQTWQELFNGELLRQEHPPRWVLFLGGGEVYLIDRYKWPQGRYLRFELSDLFGRRHNKALEAMAALLHCQVLHPEQGQSLHERLDENSHKHAYAVSSDLKYGAREAIEILANEVLHDRRHRLKKAVFSDPAIAQTLTDECLIYLYRLLFLFYVESRGGELGLAPMGSESYRRGYSLEVLRDLELVPLTTPEAQNGYYIHQSLSRLFELMQQGFQMDQGSLDLGHLQDYGFEIPGLHSDLFNPERTPMLSQARFRNAALQKVLELLSLSRTKGRNQRGRISYAQLGINQLGAVYEGLLSYTGFFAQEELIEVRNPKDDKEGRVFFVPLSRMADYKPEEVVKDENDQPRRHAKGQYLFRLAGRDREKSASYYTPEVLTRCLTKFTLAERLKDLAADEILNLSVLEPAMGSGAFLNEALNQLADAYLQRKQQELQKLLPAEDYQRERQKVKYYLATHNLYGVDKNPRAALLAEVSIWLNCLVGATERKPAYPGMYLGARLVAGNSLIGARRQVYSPAILQKGKWHEHVPEAVPIGSQRQPGHIYHFLLTDPAMSAYEGDKKVAKLVPEAIATLKKWRKQLSLPLDSGDLTQLERLSERVDQLWQAHLVERQRVLSQIRQPVQPWGQPARKVNDWVSADQARNLLASLDRGTSPGRRLQAVMDYWCALWFWPLEKMDLLPSRDELLVELEALMEDSNDVDVMLGREFGRFDLPSLPAEPTQGDLFAEAPPISKGRARERLELVGRLSVRYRFHHWELAFPEVFAERGGFDLILGNPPWIKVEWSEQSVLADAEPSLEIRGLSAKQVDTISQEILYQKTARVEYLREFEEQNGTKLFLNSFVNYSSLQGMQTNLFKNFLARAFEVISPEGSSGFVHPDGVFDDPDGGSFRAELYQRLRYHFQFINELSLFEEVGHTRRYSLNVYSAKQAPDFINISALLHPLTIESSFVHNGLGSVNGVRDEDGSWSLGGHRDRVIRVGPSLLKVFSSIYDPAAIEPIQARLPALQSNQLASVLQKIATIPRKFRDLDGGLYSTEFWHETNSQKDGTILRRNGWARSPEQWVVSGPHFHVGNPLNKTPNEGCNTKSDYSSIDLTLIAEDYLPRTNYMPGCSVEDYQKRCPSWEGKPASQYYRLCFRNMLAPTGERTLIPSIIPPGPAHIHTVISIGTKNLLELVSMAGLSMSVVYDFIIRSGGRGHLYPDDFGKLPYPKLGSRMSPLILRALLLNCLTEPYAKLWEHLYSADFLAESFSFDDPRLPDLKNLTPGWTWKIPLRNPYARRIALVEIDVIAAQSLGLSLEELIVIYRTNFGVMRSYESETYYDSKGQIAFTNNRGLSGVGLERKQFEEIRKLDKGEALPSWAAGYSPPFDVCDRENDYKVAYAAFEAKSVRTEDTNYNQLCESYAGQLKQDA